MRLALSLLASSLVVCGLAQLTKTERDGIESALFVGNLTTTDLNFARRTFDDPRTPALVKLGIDKPLDALDMLTALHGGAAKRDVRGLLAEAGRLLEFPVPDRPTPVAVAGEIPKEIPEALKPIIVRLAVAVATANKSVRAAQAKLKPDELRTLLEGLPQWGTEEDSVKFEFVQKPKASRDVVLALADKIELDQMAIGADILAEAVEKDKAALVAFAKTTDWKGLARFRLGELVIVVGGIGDDEHKDRDARLVIDLGGDDRYSGRAGAGPGYAALSIDVAGDDRYRLPDVGAGCGLVGVGMAYDWGGHDDIRAKSLALGAGLAGIGVFFKDGGDDAYFSSTLSQGFGEYGVGLLVDTRGRDLYVTNLYGQGSARTQGVGWQVDQAGNDTYRAGDLILNSPLFSDVHYSFSQGFGGGYREDNGGLPGGIGLLTDAGGHDAYIAETYAQGASYWYSVGSLGDLAGKDTYRGYHYCQASAMHATGAYLIDLADDDSYIVNFGAAHAIGHDYGVAVLFDRSGNDVYAGRDSRPGIGNANGLGLFVDASGEDRYSGPPGWGNPARGSGSLGVFADLAGPDQYRDGLNDEEAASRPGWGVAFDAETKRTDTVAPPDDEPAPKPGSQPKPSDAELAQIYAKATQWGVGTAELEVKENTRKLIAIGAPALEWMVANKLAGADRLQLRAFTAVVRALGTEGNTQVAMRIRSGNVDEARNALRICSDIAAREAGPFLSAAFANPALMLQAARAAGVCGAKEAVPDLMRLCASQDRMVATAAAVSMAQIGDPQSLGTAQALLSSQELPIRKAAIQYLGKVGGYEVGKAMLNDSSEAKVRTAIEVLAQVGSDLALDLVGPLLNDGRPGIRIQTLLALDGRAPDAYKQAVLERRRDPDPRVRAVAARIDPGR